MGILIKGDMTEQEYREAVERIVASGYGRKAIGEINSKLMFYEELAEHKSRENRSRLRAISKIANSSQTASQKIHGIKALAESELTKGGDSE